MSPPNTHQQRHLRYHHTSFVIIIIIFLLRHYGCWSKEFDNGQRLSGNLLVRKKINAGAVHNDRPIYQFFSGHMRPVSGRRNGHWTTDGDGKGHTHRRRPRRRYQRHSSASRPDAFDIHPCRALIVGKGEAE